MERNIDSAAKIVGNAYENDPDEAEELSAGEVVFEGGDVLTSDCGFVPDQDVPAQDGADEANSNGSEARSIPIDRHSAVVGLAALIGYFAIAMLSHIAAREGDVLAGVWLPDAAAIALLLVAQPRISLPVLAGVALASIASLSFAGPADLTSAAIGLTVLSSLALIITVTRLTRKVCGDAPNLADLSHLGYFLQLGAVVGPLVSACIIAPSFGISLSEIWSGASTHFLAQSMGVMLLVPASLLVADCVRQPAHISPRGAVEAALTIGAGLAAVYLVFNQSAYPLLFLVPPVTLLIALRHGAVGTALFVPAIALIVCLVSASGLGPFAQIRLGEATQLNLIQAFIAANFLTGLPVAAILAGREKLNDELGKGRRELALLTEGITDAVLLIDLDGVCTYASPSVRDVLGRDPEYFLGHRVDERTHEDARDRIETVLRNLQEGTSEKERLTYRRLLDDDKGNPVFIEADCAVVMGQAGTKHSGKPYGMVMSARDVTERVELELLLTRARKSAEKAARAKSEFLANMSHEIRTPMNGVLGFAELLREANLSDENRRYADMIVQSGRSMMELLNDILDLSKIEAGQVGIASEPVDLFATLSECAALYRPTAEKKSLRLEFSISQAAASLAKAGVPSPSSPWIKTDALRLRQIVLNLMGNAIKFTEEGEVHIAVSGDEEELSIAVTDTGIGISKARLSTIFAPFTQGQSDTARRYGGTGLGLSISHQLTELLGGTIEVESEAGVGSCFTLTLPATYTEAVLPDVDAQDGFEPSMLPQQASILLVEDHDVNRLLVTEMLERCGQSVATAHDGNEGIAMVIDSIMRGKPYDLILMDVQMPGCDGYAATRAIRAEGITPDELPIIALTAHAFPEDLAAARDAGMQAHLTKPMVFADLARALQRWLPTRIIEQDEQAALSTLEKESKSEAAQDDIYEPSDVPGDVPSDTIATRIVDISRDQNSRSPKIGDGLTGEDLEAAPSAGKSKASNHARAEDNALRHQLFTPATARSLAHSPTILRRWTQRRKEAVEAVRTALEEGMLSASDEGSQGASQGAARGAENNLQIAHEELAKLVHKLAGTAAIFGEAELGDQAAALEHALRAKLPADVRETLAFELLSVADDPADTLKELES